MVLPTLPPPTLRFSASPAPPRRFALGVDPGLSGALAVVSVGDTGPFKLEDLTDMPILATKSAKAHGKNTIDYSTLFYYFNAVKLKFPGITAVLERVASRPKESPTSAFTFGESFGALKMALVAAEIPWALVTPQEWKRKMRVPPEPVAAIIARADQMFPADTRAWRGPRGGLLDGRAEAAILAAFGLLQDGP